MSLFRPCIDLHEGHVKQIVGGSLSQDIKTNYVSDQDAASFASMYRELDLLGGHVISLGSGNQHEAIAALKAFPGGLQYGGGVTAANASNYLDAGASHVIVTSYLFVGQEFSWERLKDIKRVVGRERLVMDLSCRKTSHGWNIATKRWQTVTKLAITEKTLADLQSHCAEFLVHAADVEGLQSGMDETLIQFLGAHCEVPVTYAGGAQNVDDLARVKDLSHGSVDLTIGSALDIFGGSGVTLAECVQWNRAQNGSEKW